MDKQPSRSMEGSMQGMDFQVKLQMLLVLRGTARGLVFELTSESKQAGKFDDVVLKYQTLSGDYRHVLLQLKHKLDESYAVSAEALLINDGPFSLPKYYESWKRIEMSGAYPNIEHVVLYTNSNLDRAVTSQISLEEATSHSLLHTICTKNPIHYKLSISHGDSLYLQLQGTSDSRKLAAELCRYLVEGSMKRLKENELMYVYHVALCTHVLEVKNERQASFRETFKHNQSLRPETRHFHRTLLSCVENYPDIRKNFFEKTIEVPRCFGKNTKKQPETLPMAEGQDYIDTFAQKFMLSVNQPSEAELTDIITAELQSLIQLHNDNLINAVYNIIKNKMNDQIKHGKCSFSNETTKALLFDCIMELVGVDHVLPVDSSMLNFNDISPELTDFLSTAGQGTVFHLRAAHTSVGTAVALYGWRRSRLAGRCYLLRPSMISKDRLQCLLVSFLRLGCRCDLLVIEWDCDNVEDLDVSCVVNPQGARLLLVTEEPHRLPPSLEKLCSARGQDSSALGDLSDDSLLVMLETQVNFQCNLVQLGSIFKDRNMYAYVDTQVLLNDLLQKRAVQIGYEFEASPDYNLDCYIERRFYQSVEFDASILTDSLPNDLIVMKMEFLQEFGEFVSPEPVLSVTAHSGRYYVLKDDSAESDFKTLCDTNSEKNIHWLEMDSQKIVWKKSRGDISRLQKYRLSRLADASAENMHVYSGSELLCDSAQSSLLISDNAGVGKSTSLAAITKTILERSPSTWLVRLNLNDHAAFLAELNESEEIPDPVDTLIDKLLLADASTSLTSSILKFQLRSSSLSGRREVIIMLDGFDEISPAYKDVSTQLIVGLLRCARLVVTTRPHVCTHVENALGLFAHSQCPLSEEEQLRFLKQYWRPETGAERVALYTDALVAMLQKSQGDTFESFYGIPLHLKMLADIYFDIPDEDNQGCLQYCASKELEPRLPTEVKPDRLYQMYIEKIFNILLNKLNIDRMNTGMIERIQREWKHFLRKHKLFALKSLFNEHTDALLTAEDQAELTGYSEDLERGTDNDGLMLGVLDGRPHFMHRTFAEYFSATFFSTVIKTRADNTDSIVCFFLETILVGPEYTLIRKFFDSQVKKECFMAVLNSGLSCIIKYNRILRKSVEEETGVIFECIMCWTSSIQAHSTRKKMDAFINGALTKLVFKHKAKSNLYHILKYGRRETRGWRLLTAALACVENYWFEGLCGLCDYCREVDVSTRDELLNARRPGGDTALLVASRAGWVPAIQLLVVAGCDVTVRNYNAQSALELAMQYCGSDTVEYLTKKCEIPTSGVHRRSLLLKAVRYRNIEMLNFLIKNDEDSCTRDRNGRSLLHIAVEHNWLRGVELVIERGVDLYAEDRCGETALFPAARRKHFSIALLLLQSGCDITHLNNEGESVLEITKQNSKAFSSFKLTQNNTDVNANMLDENAAENAWWTIVQQHVSEIQTDVLLPALRNNSPQAFHNFDLNRRSELIVKAVRSRRYDNVKQLLDSGEDVNTTCDEMQNSLLHISARTNWVQGVCVLIEHHADVHVENKLRQTALHLALRNNSLSVTRLLMEAGSNLYHRKESTLEVATEFCGYELLKYLRSEGLEIHPSLLLLKAVRSKSEANLLSELLAGGSVDTCDDRQNSLLHIAVGRRWSEGVRLLRDRGAAITLQNDSGETALMLATRLGETLAAQYLGSDEHIQHRIQCRRPRSQTQNQQTMKKNTILNACRQSFREMTAFGISVICIIVAICILSCIYFYPQYEPAPITPPLSGTASMYDISASVNRILFEKFHYKVYNHMTPLAHEVKYFSFQKQVFRPLLKKVIPYYLSL